MWMTKQKMQKREKIRKTGSEERAGADEGSQRRAKAEERVKKNLRDITLTDHTAQAEKMKNNM